MESPYNRKKEPELNKQLIIDAATEIGSETDWHAVTFQSIADRTGLSKGGIIHHFRNKEELLDELVNQSLLELTTWIEGYKATHGESQGVLGYLKFVLTKGEDEKYKKTMRIVLQAIMISLKYRQQWDGWYQQHINPLEQGSGIQNLIICLVADGIWYGENVGTRSLKFEDKLNIINYLEQLK